MGSVSDWIEATKAGDDEAVERLWHRYYERLVQLAYQKLKGRRLRTADEEDIAQSAFRNFCARAKAGKYPKLSDRKGLWRLFMKIVSNKTVDFIRAEQHKLNPQAGLSSAIPIADDEPTPAEAAFTADEYERLMELLGDERLQAVADLRMAEFTLQEIADQLECSLSTVERSLRLVRRKWEGELGDKEES